MASPHVAITDLSSPLFALFVSTVSRNTPCIRLCYCCLVPLTFFLCLFVYSKQIHCGFTVLPKGHAFSCQTVRVVRRSELNCEAFKWQFGSWNWIEVVRRMQNSNRADCWILNFAQPFELQNQTSECTDRRATITFPLHSSFFFPRFSPHVFFVVVVIAGNNNVVTANRYALGSFLLHLCVFLSLPKLSQQN